MKDRVHSLCQRFPFNQSKKETVRKAAFYLYTTFAHAQFTRLLINNRTARIIHDQSHCTCFISSFHNFPICNIIVPTNSLPMHFLTLSSFAWTSESACPSCAWLAVLRQDVRACYNSEWDCYIDEPFQLVYHLMLYYRDQHRVSVSYNSGMHALQTETSKFMSHMLQLTTDHSQYIYFDNCYS